MAASKLKIPPGPKLRKLLGSIPEMRRGDISALMRYVQEFGDIIRFKVGPRTLYSLNHPDFVRHVTQTNVQNYSRETRGWRITRMTTGPSVLTITGEPWKWRRRLMQPLFNPSAIASWLPMMSRIIGEMLEEFSEKQARGEIFELRSKVMRITLRMIGETIVSEDVARFVDKVQDAMNYIFVYINQRYTSLINAPLFIPTSGNLKFRKALQVLDEMAFHYISERRKSLHRPDDLLTRLLEATNPETGKPLTDLAIRNEILTIFLAGHETTATVLTWAFVLLAQNPHVEEKLYLEASSEIKNWPPSQDDLAKMKYATHVVEETLRLYPSVWMIPRRAEQADEMGGFHIPAKATVFFSPYVMHRDSRFWSDPEKFDPERFTPVNRAKIKPYTYLPFNEGPHKCLGYHFAMMESSLILSSIARHFRLRLVPDQDFRLFFSTTARPQHKILMTLEKR